MIHSESIFVDSGAHTLYNLYVLGHGKRKGRTGRELAKPLVRWSQGDFTYYDLSKGSDFRRYCDRYASFMRAMKGRDLLLANVDVISNPDLTWEVQRFFEEEHGVQPVPIIHYGTEMRYVDRYLKAGKYDLLGLGGLGQGVSRHEYFSWADELFCHICPESNGYLPLIKTHGFAMTSWELMCRYPWYCMTDDHEVLTRRGWKGRDGVLTGEDVLVYNEDGTSDWSPVLEIPEFTLENEEIYHLSNRSFEAFVTPNHRWLVEERHGQKGIYQTEWKTTREMVNRKHHCRIPRRADHAGFPKKEMYRDEVIELLAWFWTDGTHCRHPNHPNRTEGICIYQSEKTNPKKCEEIKDLLRRTGDKWHESRTLSDPGMVQFCTQGATAQKVLRIAPKKKVFPLSFILDLTERQLGLFMDTSLKGDGTRKVRLVREEGFELPQKHGPNIETFRVAAILAGYSTSMQMGEEYAEGKRMSLLRSSSVPWAYPAHTKIEKINHTGKVWCVRVKSGAFFTRCKGHVYVTGNSVDSATWVKLAAYGWLYLPRWSEGKWRFDRPPMMINFSFRSPRKSERQKHYDNVPPEVRRIADRWLKHLGLEMGSVDEEGEVKVFGVSSHHRARSIANLHYLKDLEESRPAWPHPLDNTIVERHTVKYTKGFGL